MFFVSIGMLVNIALIPEAIWITIPIVIVAIVGKFIGNMFAASFAGNTLVSASTIGVVMIPIGEFSFIIAKLGADSGSIRDSIFSSNGIGSHNYDADDATYFKSNTNKGRSQIHYTI